MRGCSSGSSGERRLSGSGSSRVSKPTQSPTLPTATHLVPVVGHLLQAHSLADVDQVEDVLLEAGAAKADRGVEELGADAGVGADGLGNLLHIGACGGGGGGGLLKGEVYSVYHRQASCCMHAQVARATCP